MTPARRRRSEPTDLGTWAARRPDAAAVVIADPDSSRPAERITYGALDAAANRLARALRRAGLRRGDQHLARYKCPRDLRFQPELP
jgi:acyl-CoA synthetase (AMP-forming)/AMP-acid ligase II